MRDRIDAQLRGYLARRPTAAWPTRDEFRLRGERELLAAIDHHPRAQPLEAALGRSAP